MKVSDDPALSPRSLKTKNRRRSNRWGRKQASARSEPSAPGQRAARTTPVRMYWWGGGSVGYNFGDELSPIVVKALSGRDVQRAPLPRAELLAIGSILQIAAKTSRLAKRTAPLWVWGSGTLAPVNFPEFPCLTVSAVRGPLTRNMLRLKADLPIGDPGLLADRLVPRPVTKRYAWGVIPHHSHVDSDFVRRLLENTPRSTLIDVRQPDVLSTISKMADCDRIASTSLHGLVVADSFHIPNIWISAPGERRTFSWKFTDYFLSVGRSLFQPIQVARTYNLDDIEETENFAYFSDIETVKSRIAAAFPDL